MDKETKEFCENMGKNMKLIMKEKGITQQELSYRTGIAQSTLSKYMNGKINPLIRPIHKISRAIGCTFDEIIGEE